jgi:hypothetical protein
MAAALHTLAVHHGVGAIDVAVGPYYHSEAATFVLPPDQDWRRLHAFLSDIVTYADLVDVKLAMDKDGLMVAVVPLTAESAVGLAGELDRYA